MEKPTTEEQQLKFRQWAALNGPARGPREAKFNAGFRAGFDAAVEDYLAGRVDLLRFKTEWTSQDVSALDWYELGFEMGYIRKLAEMNVC